MHHLHPSARLQFYFFTQRLGIIQAEISLLIFTVIVTVRAGKQAVAGRQALILAIERIVSSKAALISDIQLPVFLCKGLFIVDTPIDGLPHKTLFGLDQAEQIGQSIARSIILGLLLLCNARTVIPEISITDIAGKIIAVIDIP